RDEFGGTDAAADAAEVYTRLAGGVADSIDGSRLGNFVNLQSLVTTFEFENRKLLLAGDMQFAKPGTNDPTIRDGVARLHTAIAEGAPYDFVKISHHGADNAFDENFLEALGSTKLFGICAGEKSTKHPHRAVLELLDRQPSSVRWPRTDRNGLTTITFSDSVRVKPSAGSVRDARPNSADEAHVSGTPERPIPPAPPPPAREVRTESRPSESGFVEVSARIPHTRTSVSITVDVAPGLSAGSKAAFSNDPVVASLGPIDIGSGRTLPKLLVVTDRLRLADNIGAGEAAAVLDGVRAKGLALIEELPTGPATEAARVVHERLKSEPGIEGVLIIGGYDVVPAHRLDTLPASLRAGVDEDDDPDDFIVWSDEIYASLDGDTVADLPISRIPDGRSSQFVRQALKASGRRSGAGRAGVRNVRRPFADEIFRILPGGKRLLQSKPTAHDQSPPLVLDGDFVYLMLHGDSHDSTRFWGEGIAGQREAVNIRNLPASSGPIVFTGCCWGALIAEPPAGQASAGQVPDPKIPERSIALTFLAKGANAFVGCTGAHYSPDLPPFGFFGGPMHEAFWRACLEGKAPAVALHEAKRRYALDLPHGQRTTVGQAIESKILRQFTCLGLGF
ncbi:MAG: hypothetical protein M3542_03890, partial [Acidobacteriota bacterium]|nr:hypothetical protein [Acidobacteriota bacterium]MDQ5871235.1 hypothetical protein [Acidobacteriota bacterium]